MIDMYNIEIIKRVLITNEKNLIMCNVYDSNNILLKQNVIGTYYPLLNNVILTNCGIESPDIDNIKDLCNNEIVYNCFNLNGLSYENR